MPHRVRRLRWQARAPDLAGALAWRRALAEQADQVQATLARVCDRVAPGPAWRHVPRLTLRLAPGAPGELGQAFELALEAALHDALAQAEPALQVDLADDAPGGAAQELRSDLPAPPVLGAAALAEYLRTGRLPWTLAGLDTVAIAEALRDAGARMAEPADDVDTLWRAWPMLGATVELRLGALLRGWPWWPAAARRRWLARHRPAAPLRQLPQALQPSIPTTDDAELAALWLAWPGEGSAPPTGDDVSQAGAWLAPRRARGGIWDELADRMDLATKADPRPVATANALRPESARAPGAQIDPPTRSSIESPIERPLGTPATTSEPGRLVPLAGLVLLHPYLPRLLKGLGLVAVPPAAVDASQLPRACALLHALAHGDAPAHEFQLPLIKLLLGHDPDTPLRAALPPPEAADLAEAAALLEAVRGHWPALRNTGVGGLRVSFLQRRGLLARGDGGWSLRLQREPFDVLLATLPWALGPIRLPWMPQPLQVEWPAA